MTRARPVRGAALAAALGLWLLGEACVNHLTQGGALPMATPERTRADGADRNAECERCHQAEAQAWRSSRHREAFSNAEFQRAYLIEPASFCRDCHAPESAAFPSAENDALGVGCITCHQTGEAVISSQRHGLERGLPAHRLERNAEFGGSGACRACHEFSFGDDARREQPLLMQRTASEHAATGATQSCADCHMQGGSHSFASTREASAHQRAVEVEAAPLGASGLRLTLRTRDVGHAYPTGDLFRRVRVVAESVGPDFQVRGKREVFLQRWFEDQPDREGRPIRSEVSDTRLQPGVPTVLDFDFAQTNESRSIHWSVRLERVLHVKDHQEAAAMIADEVVLAEGTL